MPSATRHPGPRPDRLLGRHYQTTLETVGRLFNRLDTAYQHASDLYGFVCNGCDDNCCQSLFYHHTLAEYVYLYAGLRELPDELRRELIVKSRQVRSKHGRIGPGPKRAFCPLNEEGRCLVYRHRPMICRLHGLPHELHYPGKPAQHGPGCDAFTALCSNIPYIPFDRTPFYKEMAALEQTLRRATGFTARLRLTVAEMVAAFAAE